MRNLRAAVALATLALAACSGGGSGSSGASALTPVTTSQSGQRATASISFRIPAPSKTSLTPASTTRKNSLSTRRPLYVSPDTSGFTLSIDGNLVFNNVPVGTATAPPAPVTIPNQTGTASYTITSQSSGGSAYYVVTASLDVLPGNHTVGVVLTAADGFVLSEDQESFTLNGGNNPGATLNLKGVVDSAFWCGGTGCSGLGTPDANNVYTLQVFATDHEGDAIAYQTAGGAPVPLDNGPVTMVETDSNNIVKIGNPGPFTDPGNAFTVSYQEAGATVQEGYPVTLQCQNVGTTTVAMRTGPATKGIVSGFNYAAPIDITKDAGDPYPVIQTAVWPAANSIVGSVPIYQDYGNEVTLNCDASLNLTIQ